jgi:phosphohistidine phosphatase SixA
MRTLLLMPRTRSSLDQPDLDDVDRMLAPHGRDSFRRRRLP